MKGKFEYSKKEGLPNGANEMETVLKAFFEARMAPFFKGGGPTKKQIATDPELRDWNKHNTELAPEEKIQFEAWKKKSDINEWDQGSYDIQGYYKDQVLGQGFDAVDKQGHRPDTYKKPNHPTFSDQSKYSKEAPAGFWEGDKYWAPSTHKDLYGPDYYNWMKERNMEDGRSEHLAGYMLPEVVINAPKKLVYKKGGIIEESYEINASDDAIKYYESLGYKVEYVDGGATEETNEEFEYTPPELNVAKADNTRVAMPMPNISQDVLSNFTRKDDSGIFKTLIAEEEKDKTIQERPYQPLDTSSQYMQALSKKDKAKASNTIVKSYDNASKSEIEELQKELDQYNYDLGTYGVDGKFGNYTKDALKSKLEDDALDIKAISKYYKKYDSSNKSKVEKIQSTLVEEGFLTEDDIDGKFGDDTKEALEIFNKSKNPDAFFFSNIPKTLATDKCARGMCEILEQNAVVTEALGVKYKNAWDIQENMDLKENSTNVFNIYNDPRFKNVKNGEELVKTTYAVKEDKVNQTTPDMYKTGDIVGVFWPGSSHHDDVLNSKTKNTHVGFISDVKDGIPMITHNVHGTVKTEPYNKVYTGWIQRPKSDMKFDKKYEPEKSDYKVSDQFIQNLETKKERPLTASEKKQIKKVATRAHVDAQTLPNLLNSTVDSKWLEGATFGITGVESFAGAAKIPRTVSEAYDESVIQSLGYLYNDKDDADISLGVGKTKFSGIDSFAKGYFDVNTLGDLSDDNKAVDVVAYKLIKHYDTFKNYGEQYPELGLTEDDIRSMSILAHNRGDSKLLTIGRRPDDFKGSENQKYYEEIQGLRDMSRIGATQNDISSGKWKYAPDFITDNMDFTAETYISKVKRYIEEVYGSDYLGEQQQTQQAEKKSQLDKQTSNRNLIANLISNNVPASSTPNKSSTFRDGVEVQDIYEYLNNKLRHR